MKANGTGGLLLALSVGLVVGLLSAHYAAPAVGAVRAEGAVGEARYSVVETEGHNLIVTDNKTNTLYFYTIDKDKEIGTELKLRGSLDLTQVGEKVLTPKTVKHDK